MGEGGGGIVGEVVEGREGEGVERGAWWIGMRGKGL